MGIDVVTDEFPGWTIADGSVLNFPPVIGSDYAEECTKRFDESVEADDSAA